MGAVRPVHLAVVCLLDHGLGGAGKRLGRALWLLAIERLHYQGSQDLCVDLVEAIYIQAAFA
jgi:hypothetical protein